MGFRRLIPFVCAAGLLAGVSLTTACGGGGEGYKLPVTHPLVPFKKPDRSQLVEEPQAGEPKPNQPLPDMGDDDDGAAATKSAPKRGAGGQ